MARRRGLGNADRLALDIANVTATGAVVAAPCFVYEIIATLTNSTTSGRLSIGDTTAAGDLVLEKTRVDLKIGSAAASGNSMWMNPRYFNPPLYVANQLFFANSTGIASVSVQYIAAS